MPEATSSLSRGSRSISVAGNGTRSLRVTTMSNSARRVTSSSSVAQCPAKLTTSMASETGDQSAAVAATDW